MRHATLSLALSVSLPLVGLAGCGSDSSSSGTAYFELAGGIDAAGTFWNLPFPNDLRVSVDGTPDYTGFPNPHMRAVVVQLIANASQRKGAPLMPVAWFRFDTALGRQYDPTQVIPADATAPIQLLDIDPDSPEQGTAYPVVAQNLVHDDFTSDFLLAVAPQPGIVLRPETTYAIVIRRGFADGSDGAVDIEPATGFQALIDGAIPAGTRGRQAAEIYEPMWPVLEAHGVPRTEVVVATVFTTGDETKVLRARSEIVRQRYDAEIGPLHVDTSDGAAHPGYCELVGAVKLSQFQTGTPPFDTDGTFIVLPDGLPQEQTTMEVPLTVTIPKAQMPAGGWPLYQFFHGSGGDSHDVVDSGHVAEVGGPTQIGGGPAAVVAPFGFATAGAALPLNPERLHGAGETEYLNLSNLVAFPFTFQQGVFEQRLLLDALLELQIDPATVAACTGVALPAGETKHHFNASKLAAGGQSMGGMYTNLIGSVEDRYGALVPTGAGGFWNFMILDTAASPGARDVLAGQFVTDADKLSFMHPGLALIASAWEIAEPMAAMSRIAHRPLAGLPARHVYEPVGADDEYFNEHVYDAAALAYGNQEAGEPEWSTMQESLASANLDGILDYPIRQNLAHDAGHDTTGVVVQYVSDGIVDSHFIFRQLDAVKHQYGCFLSTWLTDGVPTVSAPGAIDAPCQHAQ